MSQNPNKKALYEKMFKYFGKGLFIPFQKNGLTPICFMLKQNDSVHLCLRIEATSNDEHIIYAEIKNIDGTTYCGASNFFQHTCFANSFKHERFCCPKHGSILWYVKLDELDTVIEYAQNRVEDIERVEKIGIIWKN
jgi:hypothetical protein